MSRCDHGNRVQQCTTNGIVVFFAYMIPLIGLVVGLWLAEWVSAETGRPRSQTGIIAIVFGALFTMSVLAAVTYIQSRREQRGDADA